MNMISRQPVRQTLDSSAVTRAVRRVTADSVLCQAVVGATRWLRQTRIRIVTGVKIEAPVAEQRRTTERLETVIASSRVIGRLASILDASAVAYRDAGLTKALGPLLSLDLETRVQMAAWIVVIATLTHIVLLAALGVPIQVLGWGVRTGLLVAALLVAWRPSAIAAAWRDRVAETGNHDDV
jgi:hypothetical protein